jgi:hypothetical protein
VEEPLETVVLALLHPLMDLLLAVQEGEVEEVELLGLELMEEVMVEVLLLDLMQPQTLEVEVEVEEPLVETVEMVGLEL